MFILRFQRDRAFNLRDLRDSALPPAHAHRKWEALLSRSQSRVRPMSEVVCIATYKRDELLALCLEAIRAQDKEIPIMVFSDRGWESDDLRFLCLQENASLCYGIDDVGYGNSRNVIRAMWEGVIAPSAIVHFIEDDTILHPSYLDWARGMLATKRFAAVCGHVGNEQDTWYTSPCASWLPDKLQICLEAIPKGYLEARTREEMQKILDDCELFKKSKFRFGSAEQDGYFLRCIEHFGWKTSFPKKPLCTHLGWFGYNRPSHLGPIGNFEQRVKWCRGILASKQKRVEMFGKRIVDLEIEGENA